MRYSIPLLVALAVSGTNITLAQKAEEAPGTFLENLLAGRAPEPPEAGIPFYAEFGKRTAPNPEMHVVKLKVSRSMATVEVDGDRSPFRISEARPRFYVKLAIAPRQDREMLVLLDAANGKRIALLSIRPGGLTQPMPGKQIEVEYKKYGQSSYLIRPIAPLRAGEYCLTFGDSNRASFFGIDPGAADSPGDSEPLAQEANKTDDPNQERVRKLDALLAQGLIEKADYDARKTEILNPPLVKPVTIEDRLKKLNELLKKGLITQPEYEKKRAEILSEM
jgi:hypothetical protein